MIVAYLRVSTSKQNLSNQQDEIRRFAQNRNLSIDRWVMEVVSGKKNKKERKLGSMLKRLKKGDTLIVTELSRLSRTLTDIMAIMGHCLEKNITLYSTKDGYAFDNSINSKVLCFAFGLVAEIERNLISLRTKEALALRRSEGVVLGRRKGSCTKLRLLMDHRNDIVQMLRQGHSIASLCRHYHVSRDTFNNLKKRSPSVSEAWNIHGHSGRTNRRKESLRRTPASPHTGLIPPPGRFPFRKDGQPPPRSPLIAQTRSDSAPSADGTPQQTATLLPANTPRRQTMHRANRPHQLPFRLHTTR